MELKLLGAAAAATLLGLSTASFGQGSGGSGSGPSGQDSATTQSSPAASSGTAVGGTTGATTGSTGATTGSTGTAAGASGAGTTTATDCDSMTGSAKARCERQHRSSRGASSSTSGSATTPNVTKRAGESGPGTSDRTGPNNQPGIGTSSAGSN
jgi:hypothetical protein